MLHDKKIEHQVFMSFIKAKLTFHLEEILLSFIPPESNAVQRLLAVNYTFFFEVKDNW